MAWLALAMSGAYGSYMPHIDDWNLRIYPQIPSSLHEIAPSQRPDGFVSFVMEESCQEEVAAHRPTDPIDPASH